MKRITSLDNIKKLDYHYWIIIAIVIISYCVYLPKHFSIDSWNVQNMYLEWTFYTRIDFPDICYYTKYMSADAARG